MRYYTFVKLTSCIGQRFSKPFHNSIIEAAHGITSYFESSSDNSMSFTIFFISLRSP